MAKKYTIAVDFDGVLHKYESPWIAAHVIPDDPVDGAIRWLVGMVQKFTVVIFSTRCKTWRGRRAVRAWLKKHAGNLYYYPTLCSVGIEKVVLTATKPAALVYIDDRAWRFEGKFPTADEIHRAKPWNKMPAEIAQTHDK